MPTDDTSLLKLRKTLPQSSSLNRRVGSRWRSLRRDISDIFRQEHFGIYIDWTSPAGTGGEISVLHSFVAKKIREKRKLFAFVASMIWPLKALLLSVRMKRKFGMQVRRNTGISLYRQFVWQLSLALRHFIPPRAFYFYGLYEAESRRRAHLYVQDHEILPLLDAVNGKADYAVFDDKRRFFEECSRFGLPTIPVIAEFEDGKLKKWAGNGKGPLPEADLFAKPALGKCGQGVISYSFKGQGLYISEKGIPMSESRVLDDLAEASKQRPYILQKKFANHPDISAIAPGALCTSRIITCRLPDGGFEDIIAIFKMPTGLCCTDNFSTGGIAIALDKENGILGTAITKELDARRVDTHPDTGRKLAGFQIPCWEQVIELCLKAHAVFPTYAYIGWDVAVTDAGPLLVEGNLRWGVESMQRAHNRPLGETRFVGTMLLHLESLKRAQSFQVNNPT
jgi:hypothetical protein